MGPLQPPPAETSGAFHPASAIVLPSAPPLRQSFTATDGLAAFAILAGAAVVLVGVAKRRPSAHFSAAGQLLAYQEELAHARARIAELESRERKGDSLAWSGVELKPAARPAHTDRRSALHSEVYALADQGWTVTRIAQRTGTQPAEIEVILNLRRVRAKSA